MVVQRYLDYKSPVIKAHGSSNARAIFNAIRQATIMAEHSVTAVIKTTIAESNTQQGELEEEN